MSGISNLFACLVTYKQYDIKQYLPRLEVFDDGSGHLIEGWGDGTRLFSFQTLQHGIDSFRNQLRITPEGLKVDLPTLDQVYECLGIYTKRDEGYQSLARIRLYSDGSGDLVDPDERISFSFNTLGEALGEFYEINITPKE